MTRPAEIIVVHGLWFGAVFMQPLARRLKRCGYRPVLLTYRSLRKTIQANARALRQIVQQQPAARVHLVMPERRLFEDQQGPPSASVVVNLRADPYEVMAL